MMSRNSDKYAQYRDVLEHYESCLDHGEIDIDCFDNKFCEVIDKIRADAIKEYKQSAEYIKECVQRYLKGKADGIDECIKMVTDEQLCQALEKLKEADE